MNGYVVKGSHFLEKTNPLLNQDCARIQSIFVWNLDSKNIKDGIWMDVTKEATKYISLEESSQIQIKDLDIDRWKGHVLKVNWGCLGNCTSIQCKRECTIIKISGYIEYPFVLEDILQIIPCVGFFSSATFLTLFIVFCILVLLLIIFNCCLLWCCCCGGGRRCWKASERIPLLKSRLKNNRDSQISNMTTLSTLEIGTPRETEDQKRSSILKARDDFGTYLGRPACENYSKHENTNSETGGGLGKQHTENNFNSSQGSVIYFTEPREGEKQPSIEKSSGLVDEIYSELHHKNQNATQERLGEVEEPPLSQTVLHGTSCEKGSYFDGTLDSGKENSSVGLVLGLQRAAADRDKLKYPFNDHFDGISPYGSTMQRTNVHDGNQAHLHQMGHADNSSESQPMRPTNLCYTPMSSLSVPNSQVHDFQAQQQTRQFNDVTQSHLRSSDIKSSHWENGVKDNSTTQGESETNTLRSPNDASLQGPGKSYWRSKVSVHIKDKREQKENNDENVYEKSSSKELTNQFSCEVYGGNADEVNKGADNNDDAVESYHLYTKANPEAKSILNSDLTTWKYRSSSVDINNTSNGSVIPSNDTSNDFNNIRFDDNISQDDDCIRDSIIEESQMLSVKEPSEKRRINFAITVNQVPST